MSRVTPIWIRWMLVDSSGSMKPLERPIDDHVLVPGLQPPAGLELEQPRLEQRLAFEVG